MRLKEEITLQNAVTITGNGLEYTVGNATSMKFDISGTSTSRTIVFEGLVDSDWRAIQCVNLSTLDVGSQTTSSGQTWEVDLSLLKKFRTRVSAIAGGNVTIKARVGMDND